MRIAARLEVSRHVESFAKRGFDHLFLFRRQGFQPVRRNQGSLREGFEVLAVRLDELVDVDLWKSEVGSELPDDIDERLRFLCHVFTPVLSRRFDVLSTTRHLR